VAKIDITVSIRKTSKNSDMFEFTVTTPIIKSQFVLPRVMLNKLRILIEKALVGKSN